MEEKVAKVIDKIKKLLQLADKNTNESEANAALLKAQALMKEYKVQVTDLKKGEEHRYARMFGEHKYNYSFRRGLAKVLANNFCCQTYESKGDGQNGTFFLGREEDVIVCVNAFNYAYDYIMKQATKKYNQAYNSGKETKGVFNGYAKGFIVGMKQVLDKQCKALMLTMPEDVAQKIKEFEEQNNVRTIKSKSQNNLSTDAFFQGIRDGKDYAAMKEKRISA